MQVIVYYARIILVCVAASLALYFVLGWLVGTSVDRHLLLVGSVIWGGVMLSVAIFRARRRR